MKNPILYVEDGPDDILLMQRAFRKISPETTLHVITNGQVASDFFDPSLGDDTTKIPISLVILDLNLPGRTGLEVLRQIRQKSTYKTVPVILFSSSDQQQDIDSCYLEGCNAYLVKPGNHDGLKTMVAAINDFWLKSNRFSKLSGGVAIVSDQDTGNCNN